MPTKHLDSKVVLDVASGSVVSIRLFNVLVQRALEKKFDCHRILHHFAPYLPRQSWVALRAIDCITNTIVTLELSK